MDSTSSSRVGYSHVGGDRQSKGFFSSNNTTQDDRIVQQRPDGVPEARSAILVMGCTGSGKSSFIAAMTGTSVDISHNLQSGMTRVPPFRSFSNLTLQILRSVEDGIVLVIPDKPSLWLIHLALMI